MTTTMQAPERTLDQRMTALAKANDIRTRRAQWKRDVKQGRESSVEMLRRPPVWAESAKVIDVLLATPKIGRVKAQRLLRQVGVSPSKTLGGLSDRQRMELAPVLESRGRVAA